MEFRKAFSRARTIKMHSILIIGSEKWWKTFSAKSSSRNSHCDDGRTNALQNPCRLNFDRMGSSQSSPVSWFENSEIYVDLVENGPRGNMMFPASIFLSSKNKSNASQTKRFKWTIIVSSSATILLASANEFNYKLRHSFGAKRSPFCKVRCWKMDAWWWAGEWCKMLQTFYAKIYFGALPSSKLNINCVEMKRTPNETNPNALWRRMVDLAHVDAENANYSRCAWWNSFVEKHFRYVFFVRLVRSLCLVILKHVSMQWLHSLHSPIGAITDTDSELVTEIQYIRALCARRRKSLSEKKTQTQKCRARKLVRQPRMKRPNDRARRQRTTRIETWKY